MKDKFTFAFSLLIVLLFFSNSKLFSQCGVYPALSSELGGIVQVNINAGPTTFDPGWVAYAWEWEVNNQVVSTDSVLAPFGGIFLPSGFNEVCLTVSATNPGTGDSCTKKVCNIFQSTASEVYAELNVSASGLIATATGYWYGLDPNNSPYFNIDWGDGTISYLSSDIHSYAAPGDYLVCFSVLDQFFTTSQTTCRKVQVDNGLSNMQIQGSQGVFQTCYPFNYWTPITTPAHSGGFAYLNTYASYGGGAVGFSNGAMVTLTDLPQRIVPGQAMLVMEINDINPNPYDISRYAPVVFDVCGVIPDTLKGYVFDDLDADGIMDPGEAGIPNIPIKLRSAYGNTSNYQTLTDTAGFYSILSPNAYVSINVSPLPAGTTLSIPATGGYAVNAHLLNNFPLYNFGIANLNTTVAGNVFLDYNQDSIRNVPPDVNFRNVTLKAENTVNGLTFYEHTNSTGAYSFKLTSGNYIITPTAYYLDSADFYPDTLTINSTGGIFNNQHFGCYSPVSGNLGVRIFGSTEARPGFNYYNNIEVKNTGFDTLSGVIIFSFDPILSADSVIPAGGVIDNVNHTVTWQTGNLPATYYSHYHVFYTIPIPTPLGTVLNFNVLANVDAPYTDSDLSNNSDTYSQTVIGSFDPNDKNVDPSGIGASGDVLHGDRLHYRIRFQNTGTASAIHVFVQDEIDPELDMSTLLMERASHAYDMVTNGRTITWKFMNINLPDSNTNEPLSHGYIEYSIKAYQGLPDGTEIENTAAIYFDYNAPVITNTTLNTLQTSLVSVEELDDDQQIMLYPVPAKNELNIVLSTTKPEELTVDMMDLNGRLIRTIYKGTSAGDLKIMTNTSGLSSGVYIIKVTNSAKVMRKMFVKQ